MRLDRWRAGRRDLVGDIVLAVAVLVVAFPILAMSLHQMRVGWAPVSDDAIIYTRTLDVLSDSPPLVGQFSLASDGGGPGQAAYSPGPMAYQLLAVPAKALPPVAMPAVVGLLNAGAFAAVLVLVRRRGGTALVAATALGLAILHRAIDPMTFVAIWNPHLAMAPFVLLLIVCWCVAAGDRWLLPLAIFLFSLVGQTHLTYVAPGVAALVVALAGGWGPDVLEAMARRSRRNVPAAGAAGLDDDALFVDDVGIEPDDLVDSGADQSDVATRPRPRRRGMAGSWWAPIAMSVVVGLVCWAAPFYEQVTGSPGNLAVILESNSGDRAHFGAEVANEAFVDTYGVPPAFVSDSQERRYFLPGAPGPSTGSTIGAVVIFGLVAAVGVVALRRGDRSLAALAVLVLAMAPTLWWIVSAFPTDRALASVYSFRWFVFVGLLAWLAVGWGVVRLWGASWAATVPSSVGSVAAGFVLIAAVVVGTQAVQTPASNRGQLESAYAAANELGDALDAATVPGGRYRIVRSGVFRYGLELGLIARLRWTDRLPVLADRRVVDWGDRYGATGVRCDGVIRLLSPNDDLAGSAVVGTSSILLNGETIEARVAIAADIPAGTC